MVTSLRIGTLVGLALFGIGLSVQSGEKGKSPDASFAYKASESDMAEIELGKLAMKQSSNASIRQFAAKMMKDHTKSSADLMAIAKQKELPLAKNVSKKHMEACEKLKAMSGPDFDREYVTGQVKAHQQAIELFTQQAKNGQDADLKAFASKTLPTIQEHYRMAQELSQNATK